MFVHAHLHINVRLHTHMCACSIFSEMVCVWCISGQVCVRVTHPCVCVCVHMCVCPRWHFLNECVYSAYQKTCVYMSCISLWVCVYVLYITVSVCKKTHVCVSSDYPEWVCVFDVRQNGIKQYLYIYIYIYICTYVRTRRHVPICIHINTDMHTFCLTHNYEM